MRTPINIKMLARIVRACIKTLQGAYPSVSASLTSNLEFSFAVSFTKISTIVTILRQTN